VFDAGEKKETKLLDILCVSIM